MAKEHSKPVCMELSIRDADDVDEFWEELVKICAKDGFRVAMPSLHGGDHLNTLQDGTGLGQGTIIGSDVGRSVRFVRGKYEDVRLSSGCSKKWKKTASKQVHTEPASECMSCWPCWKLRAAYPEFFDKALADGKSVIICPGLYACEY